MDTAAHVYQERLDDIREAGLYKKERVLTSEQDADIDVAAPGPTPSASYSGDGAPTSAEQVPEKHVINFCANNYLGLANDERLEAAAKEGVDRYGFGLASVRFICGTQTIHKQLEARLANFFETDDAILYAACFDANTGLFETLLGEEDAVISDALNHASIIDGIRLCKAERYRFAHSDMDDLEAKLQEAQDQRVRLIATDGVFSMDGDVAKLSEICDLADAYDAMVMVDDCHGTGFFGETGRGSLEYTDTLGRVDIVTSTLGKALGGATGGFTAARQDVVDLLRQQSRPYLFSNSVAPPIVYTSLKALDLLEETTDLRDTLRENTRYFRGAMTEAGFAIKEGEHPIVPIMLGKARLASEMADDLLDEGIYVIGFSYPVVPKGEARIRVQVSAAHTQEQLDRAVEAFAEVGRRHEVIE
jgi:glycine C-acetyltransferase